MNYISLNNTESENIRILPSGSKEKQGGGAEIDPMDEINAYIELIKENLHYDILRERYTGTDAELYESIFRVICHVVTGKGKKYHKIGNLQFPQETVKSVFLKLRQKHVGIVMEGYNKTVTEVTDMNAYLIASLYNAYLTGDLYWDRRVRHDMYGGGNEEQ